MTAFDDPIPHDVYWLYDSEDRVLYIGLTRQIEERLIQHSKDKGWWEQISRVEVQAHPSRRAAFEAERDAIYAERPIFNKRRTPPPPVLPPIIRRGEPLRAVENFAGERNETVA